MSYQLYIANKNYSSWSLRPWVLLRELGIAFEEIVVPFSTGSNWNAYRRFSPSGKVPCLIDDNRVIWDSLAIVEYLAELHKSVWPQDAEARAWARCASAEMHSGFSTIRTHCPMNVAVRVQLNQVSDALNNDLARLIELWEEGLAKFNGPFLAGNRFTAVDAFFAPIAFRVQSYGLALSPQAKTYTDRLLNLSSMQEWQKGALNEEWREEGHEKEAVTYGVLINDLRTSNS